MGLVFTIVSLLSLALLPVASASGYGVAAVVRWWLFSALVVFTGTVAGRRLFPWRGAADSLIRTAILCFAIVVFCSGALGVAGWLAPVPYAALLAALLAGSLCLKRRTEQPASLSPLAFPRLAVGFGAAMLILVVSDGLVHSPLTAYDSLSYHLFFPARWLQAHQLSIIATPFSDEAQAYAPANGELYLLWLMLPFHGDLLARIGQVPFLLLIGLTLYALARRTGAPPVHAIYPAVFCVASRLIVEQAVGADVDLVCWSLFLTSLYLGLVAVESNDRRDWIMWGVSLGLHWGTKYVALVYSPVLLLLPFIRGVKPKALWALLGIAAFALPWYLRNWMIAGSPLYPASLTVAGVTIARGAFTRAAMLHSLFHTTDLRLLPVMAAHAFGVTLFLCWAAVVGFGAWALARRPQRWPAWFLLCAPILMTTLYWLGVPDNVDSRFLLPAAMLALVPLAFTFEAFPAHAWRRTVHLLYAAAMFGTAVGADVELPAELPAVMGGWLSLSGLVGWRFLPLFFVLALVLGAVWWAPRRSRRQLITLAGLVLLAAAALVRGADAWCGPARCEYLRLTSIYLRPSFLEAWQWVGAHVTGATFAYTGNNVPYPLVGPHLTNRVLYVNIDRHVHWRFHDYDRAARARNQPPDPSALATGSGVLLPAPPGPGPLDVVRPRYERMQGDRDAWIRNLRVLGVDHLFVSALSGYEIDYVWHTGAGFPIEDDWARADPEAFALIYENPQVHVYRVRR